MKSAERMKYFRPSVFSRLDEEKRRLQEKGEKIIDFSIGSPDIAPAPHIMEALLKAAEDPANYRYAIHDLPRLQQAITDWYRRRYDVELDPCSEVITLQGSQEALANIALTLCDPGDIVLVPDPYYPIFAQGPKLAGADVRFMPMKEENDFLIRFDEISEEVAKKAVLMIVSYPNNPTGAVADDRFYTELIAFAKRWDIAVLHDNAYSELVFDGKRGKSFLSYPGAKDVGVELNSFSKTYGMAGARLGVCVGNRELIAGYHRLKSNMDYGIFLPVQQAGIAALEADQNCVETTRKAYEHRRDLLVRRFGEAGWVIRPSAATMFVWARIPDAFADSEQFALSLLAECGIVVTPGTEFGAEGRRHVRIALVISDEQIEEAAQRLARSCLFSGGSDIMKPTDSGKDENK
ncbi:MAG TPA: aminotransferase class I/II-fold pyridoxal phosphate-dependent enzyme [Candidatus Merdibacter merdipullorum]|nr:aminotransferase class I/II-fold pyridoxal phosphate-dependent enzyme [Candidatus Merdibacter merdipullorum]